MTTTARPQLAFDETLIDDDELEESLESREEAKAAAGVARKAYNEANEAAGVEVAKLELPDGKAVRCGRFRVTRSAIPARAVSFDVKPSTRVRITVVGEEE